MGIENRLLMSDPAERVSAFLLALALTFLVFAAINVGFAPQTPGI